MGKAISGNPGSPRLAIFTHDAYGLGHVQRCLRIVRALADRAPEAPILFITGSPALDIADSMPPNADYIKIPTTVLSDSQGPKPPTLGVGLSELLRLREQLVRQAIRTFAPDVLLVDNFPLGSHQELLPALQQMRILAGSAILGLRDIVDAPEKLRRDWQRQGIYEVLARYYDRILVYGVPEVLDAAEACALPPALAARLHYCGYVTANAPALRDPSDVRAELGIAGPFIVASVGGGGDGFPLIDAFLQAVPLLPATSALAVTGQFMSPADRAELQARAAGLPGVVVRDHVPDLPSYLAAADVVVAMGGYNTTAEILAVNARAIVVPRTWRPGQHANRAHAATDAEQLLRARALAASGLIDLPEPQELEPGRLAERIRAGLDSPAPRPKASFDLGGAGRVASHMLTLAQGQEGSAGVSG